VPNLMFFSCFCEHTIDCFRETVSVHFCCRKLLRTLHASAAVMVQNSGIVIHYVDIKISSFIMVFACFRFESMVYENRRR